MSLPESWRPCPGAHKYAVHIHGKVMNVATGRELTITHRSATYWPIVQLGQAGMLRTKTLPSLVWEAFSGPIPEGHRFIAKDGDRSNCRLDNLELVRTGVRKSNSKKAKVVSVLSAIESLVKLERSLGTAELEDPARMKACLRLLHDQILDVAMAANVVRYGSEA